MKKRLIELVRALKKKEKEASAEGATRAAQALHAAERQEAVALQLRDAETRGLRETELGETKRLADGTLRATDLVQGDFYRRAAEGRVKHREELARKAGRDVRAAATQDGAARDALARAHVAEHAVERHAAHLRAEVRARDERRDDDAAEDATRSRAPLRSPGARNGNASGGFKS